MKDYIIELKKIICISTQLKAPNDCLICNNKTDCEVKISYIEKIVNEMIENEKKNIMEEIEKCIKEVKQGSQENIKWLSEKNLKCR